MSRPYTRYLTGRGGVRFDTKRDFNALGELLKRTSLGYKEPGVWSIDPVVNEDSDIECEAEWEKDDREFGDPWSESCDRPADVRIVRNRGEQTNDLGWTTGPARVYSETYCLRCIRKAMYEWVDGQVDRMADAVEQKRADGDSG